MSCESSSKNVTLSREYKYLLSRIKPLIEELDKSKDAQLCLLWLSKLDQCSRSEEFERNEILSELSRQVKNKRLEPPFNCQPPPGPLKNVTLRNSISLRTSNDYSDDVSSDLSSGTSFRSPRSSMSNRTSENDRFQNVGTPLTSKLPQDTSNCFKAMKGFKDLSRFLSPRQECQERDLSDQLLIARYQEIIRSLVTSKLKNSGSVKLDTLRSSYENRIRNLSSSLRLLEEENKCLKLKISTDSVDSEKLRELELRNAELKEKIGELERANNVLHLRCLNLETEKDSSAVELTDKLNESEKRAKELDDRIRIMEEKYEENLRTSEAEHGLEMSELEKKCRCEVSMLERILEEKQCEIDNITKQFSTKCLHFETEILRLKHEALQNPELEKEKRKVKFLKSKLKNSEKLHDSLATTFQSQLEQLIAKKDLVISTLELKLKSQECEKFGVYVKPGLDNLISETVCLLEAQYRKLLEESENQAIQRRQIDLEKILTLEKQLVDHGVGIQDLNQICYSENLMLSGPNENAD